jgi:hypothetical protein
LQPRWRIADEGPLPLLGDRLGGQAIESDQQPVGLNLLPIEIIEVVQEREFKIISYFERVSSSAEEIK